MKSGGKERPDLRSLRDAKQAIFKAPTRQESPHWLAIRMQGQPGESNRSTSSDTPPPSTCRNSQHLLGNRWTRSRRILTSSRNYCEKLVVFCHPSSLALGLLCLLAAPPHGGRRPALIQINRFLRARVDEAGRWPNLAQRTAFFVGAFQAPTSQQLAPGWPCRRSAHSGADREKVKG